MIKNDILQYFHSLWERMENEKKKVSMFKIIVVAVVIY